MYGWGKVVIVDKLLDNIEDVKIPEVFINSIYKSHAFLINRVVQDAIDVFTKDLTLVDSLRFFKLPYKDCFFEFDIPLQTDDGHSYNKMCFLLFFEDNIIYIIILRAGREGYIFTKYYSALKIANTLLEETTFKLYDYEHNPVSDKEEEKKYIQCLYRLSTVIYMINCPNIIQCRKANNDKLNKKRASKGRPKLRDSSEILLNISRKEVELIKSGNSGGGCRKTHARRGHFRRLPEKVVWVRDCIVGSGDKIKKKHYKCMDGVK